MAEQYISRRDLPPPSAHPGLMAADRYAGAFQRMCAEKDGPEYFRALRDADEAWAELARALGVTPIAEAEPCWCDRQGIGAPGVSCGDCPTRDYKRTSGVPALVRASAGLGRAELSDQPASADTQQPGPAAYGRAPLAAPELPRVGREIPASSQHHQDEASDARCSAKSQRGCSEQSVGLAPTPFTRPSPRMVQESRPRGVDLPHGGQNNG